MDEVDVERFWRDIRQAVRESPSGSELRDMACVDIHAAQTSLDTESQSRPMVEVHVQVTHIVVYWHVLIN